MATKTSLLGLTKPAYTDAADIAVLNTNFDLIDKAVGNRTRVHNLLVNSWFVNPVNHRGQTTYSNGYTIDRWSLLYNNVSTLNVTSDGLKFTSGSGDCWLLQRFERPLKVGAPYTFAVQYADGTKDVISLNVADESAYIQGAHCIYSINKDHFAIVGRDIPNGIVIQWVALYEGTYDADTLPTYVVPDKRIEMFRCGVPMNPPNLLVNSWFVNPVNHQGRTGTYEGVASYTTFVLDRWKTWSTGCSYAFTSIGLQITNKNTSSAIGPYEVLTHPEQMKGKTYTLAVGYGGGNVVCGSVTVPSGSVTADKYMTAVNASGAIPGLRLIIYAKDQRVEFQIMVVAGQTVTVEWAALYEGVYDAETLPTYVVPDKRAEMIRCGVPMNPNNLLVNGWFVNPVNQRGASSYTDNGHTIDHWRDTTNSTMLITANGLTLQNNSTTSNAYWRQRLPASVLTNGKTYTMAIEVGGVMYCGHAVVNNTSTATFYGANGLYLSCTGLTDNTYWTIQIALSAGKTFTGVRWAALYEGAYDVDTLPEYAIPDKRAEMIRCGVPLNPPNLLDNSWFANPIAQAGKNGLHGVNKMPCDRWISWDKDATFGNGYMTVNSPYDQRLDPSMIDVSKMYTAAVCFADGTVTCASGTFATGFGGYASVGFNCVANDNGIPYFRLWNNQAFSVRWAALYEGAYDAETLPEYHYKGYAAELAECQRYYENSWFGGTVASATRQFMGMNISATQGDCYVQFMTPKAKVATITLYKASSTSTVSVWEMYRSSHYYEVTVESLGRDGRNGFVVRFTKTDADPTAWAAREAVPLRGHWEACADL